MPFLSADEALETLETGLRLVIKEVMGEDWVMQVKDSEALAGRVKTEENQRDGVITSTDPIDYTMFYQLFGMIKSNWQRFQPVFLDQKRFEVWMKEADHVRNAIAHQRPLVTHEQDLISGISLQIRNLITLFRTQRMSSNAYYPIIESARDNFGRNGYRKGELEVAKVLTKVSPIRIDVGQTVIITCVGSDPQGRDLEWVCRPDYVFQSVEPNAEVGQTVSLYWTPTAEDVSENIELLVQMRAKDSAYHRQRNLMNWPVDDSRIFWFAVNPPLSR